jgi:SpoIID/LytB domain protein
MDPRSLAVLRSRLGLLATCALSAVLAIPWLPGVASATSVPSGVDAISMAPDATGPTPAEEVPLEGTFRFLGRGTDHGVGLSQQGAAGRAKAGQGYPEILAHYFPGTELKSIPVDTVMRALIVDGFLPKDTETFLTRAMTTGFVIDSPAVVGQVFPANAVVVLIGRARTGPWTFEVRAGQDDPTLLAAFTDDDADLRLTPVPPVDTVVDALGDTQVLIRNSRYDRFQGTLRIGRKHGKIRIVNEVPIEPFVRSVTPQEVGPSNPMEALKTQAVCARSYWMALRRPRNPWYDVVSIRFSHSYKGIQGEKRIINRAVDATAYQVLEFRGQIAKTFYHSTGGGATESSWNVFTNEEGVPGSRTPYLPGGPDLDPNGVPYDVDAPAFSWKTGTFTLEQLSTVLARDPRTNVGTLTAWPVLTEAAYLQERASDPARPANRGVSGRLIWVVLEGTSGKKRVAGWLFKSIFNSHQDFGEPLRSTLFFLTPAS